MSNLIERRKSLKLTQRQLADAIGVTVQTISNWETKHSKPKLTIEQTEQLCKLLNTDIKGLREIFQK